MYETIRVMNDSPERTAIYEKMATIIIEDCPWIFMFQPMSYGVKHSWIENYWPHDFPYGMAKYRRVNSQKRRTWFDTHGKIKLEMTGRE
jgi:ABC-type transport system substrate-binding protein